MKRALFVGLVFAVALPVRSMAQNARPYSKGGDVRYGDGSFSGDVTVAGVCSAGGLDGGVAVVDALKVKTGPNSVHGDLTTDSTTSAAAFDGGTYVARGGSGAKCFQVTTNGCQVDFGDGANDHCVSSGGTVTCAGDFAVGGFMQSVTANGGFRSSGSTSALLQGFPNDSASAIGVRLNAGVAFTTPGSSILTLENGAAVKARFNRNGRYILYGEAAKRIGRYQTDESTDTAFVAIGLPAPTILAGTPTASIADTAYQAINYATGTSLNDAAGYSGPFTTVRSTFLPHVVSVVRTDPSTIGKSRIWVGFGASSLDQVATLAGVNTIRGCWFRYDSELSDTNWQAVSSDGTTASATDTGIAVATATTYTLGIDNQMSGVCDFWVNGIKRVAKSTNINADSTALGLQASITTADLAARNLLIMKTIVEQN